MIKKNTIRSDIPTKLQNIHIVRIIFLDTNKIYYALKDSLSKINSYIYTEFPNEINIKHFLKRLQEEKLEDIL